MTEREISKILGEEILDPDEEHFLLFSSPIPSSNLGFLSSTSAKLAVSVAGAGDDGGDELTIHQSPGLLASDAASGTTGAVLWKITPLVAEWLLQPDNVVFRRGGEAGEGGGRGLIDLCTVANDDDDDHDDDDDRLPTLLELGCGIAGVVALALRRRVARYLASDLDYVLRGLRKNLAENGAWVQQQQQQQQQQRDGTDAVGRGDGSKSKKAGGSSKSRRRGGATTATATASLSRGNVVEPVELDWTECTPELLRASIRDVEKVDCILACDCIYNESLVDPFVQTCVDASRMRPNAPICVVAQQIRSDLVFEAWLRSFHQRFHVWRIGDSLLTPGLREGSGYVVHAGYLRQSEKENTI